MAHFTFNPQSTCIKLSCTIVKLVSFGPKIEQVTALGRLVLQIDISDIVLEVSFFYSDLIR